MLLIEMMCEIDNLCILELGNVSIWKSEFGRVQRRVRKELGHEASECEAVLSECEERGSAGDGSMLLQVRQRDLADQLAKDALVNVELERRVSGDSWSHHVIERVEHVFDAIERAVDVRTRACWQCWRRAQCGSRCQREQVDG